MGVELRIASEEAVRLANELAGLKNESVETAILAALRERLARERERKAKLDRIKALAEELRAHMTEPVSSDHSWLYDENGLPK